MWGVPSESLAIAREVDLSTGRRLVGYASITVHVDVRHACTTVPCPESASHTQHTSELPRMRYVVLVRLHELAIFQLRELGLWRDIAHYLYCGLACNPIKVI